MSFTATLIYLTGKIYEYRICMQANVLMKQTVSLPEQKGGLRTLYKANTSISGDVFITENDISISLAS